jgi:phosphate acetyltransferase
VIPEHPILDKLTVGEIARALNAEYLQGDADSLSHTVNQFRVAAMELPQFLDWIEEGDLVITPGDRADIVLGSLAVEASRSYPHIAGLLLTGGFKPAPQVQRLIQGLGRLSFPILSVTTDTYTTAARVSSLRSTLVPEDHRKITAALGIMEASVRFDSLQRRLTLPRSRHVTPFMFEYELIQRARSTRRHIVLPEGTEERILRAAEILLLRDVVNITLLGDPERIRQRISLLGIKVEGVNIVNPLDSPLREMFAQTYYDLRKHKGVSRGMAFDAVADNTYFGTLMVHHGHADGMVSGAIHTTSHTIRPAFEIIRSRPGFSIVSSVFLMCLADRVLVFGDCAVNADPTPEQLADIAISSAETAQMFGIEPYVAMLSYSTGESGKGADVDKVREGTLIAKRRRPNIKIEGPIQYDAAIDLEVARTKLPESEVAGNATVFIFPDLNTGNTTYKAVQRSANAVAIGPILQGLNNPVNDLSRGCTVTDIINTVAITAIQAQAMKEPE